MQEKIKNVLDGKAKVTDLTPEELPEFIKAAQAEADKTRGEVTGLREAKRAETERVEKLKEDVTKAEKIISDAKAAEEALKASQGQATQFRQEQVGTAFEKYFSQNPGLTDEVKNKIKDNFKKLDSGKLTPDLIAVDIASAHAASDPQGYMDAKKKLAEMHKGAADANADAAGSHQSPPAGDQPPKFDDKTVKVAKEAGITPEEADKVLKEGMTRKL